MCRSPHSLGIVATALAALLATACRPADPPPAAAASDTLLAAAVRDVLGEDAPVLILAEPGACPGHFDVRPSLVGRLRGCRALFRLDFQTALDRQVARVTDLRIFPVHADGGLCEPDTYQSIAAQVCSGLVESGTLAPDAGRARLAELDTRLTELSRWAREQVHKAGLVGAPVLTSQHQAAFCRTLGLTVAATFTAPDSAVTSGVETALRSARGVGLVVANLPEGTDYAEALASRLGARLVIFRNFPDPQLDGGRFEDLVRDNVRRLVSAAAP